LLLIDLIAGIHHAVGCISSWHEKDAFETKKHNPTYSPTRQVTANKKSTGYTREDFATIFCRVMGQ
jgi:hypothetical protein